MNSKHHLLLTCCALLGAAAGRAEEGEVSFALLFLPEMAWVSHPLTGEVVPFAESSSLTFLPRVGGQIGYGISNGFSIAAGLDATAFPGLVAKGVPIENTTGDVASGARTDLLLPLTLGYRLDTGIDLSANFELSAGPALVGWLQNVALNPDVLGENGLPTELGVPIEDIWNFGAFGRVTASANFRLFDVFVGDVGVTTTVAFAQTASVHVGLLLRPSFVWGGPL